ncbi:MAG TPA: hypothetical protein VML75_29170 [Kofleriaceae bacterium]|nr:hypothetical protein [Kofleriaceae bacterium]
MRLNGTIAALMRDWLRTHAIHLVLFGIGLLVFGGTAASRLKKQSPDPHFVYQADAWLNGRLEIEPMPPGSDDPARVETVLLDDGTEVRGRRLVTRGVFRTTTGREVPLRRVQRSLAMTTYNSFPPLPAVLMLPQALIHGKHANDVALTVLIAALVLPLFFAVLRRLPAAGLSRRTVSDDLWLVGALAFGSVFFFSAVQGRVWYTAHVVGVALGLAYLLCSIEARRPIAAGVALGLAAITRTPMAFMFPLFLFEAWRMAGGREDLRGFVRQCAFFAAPVVAIAIAAAVHNYLRFDELTEFGHSYLQVRQRSQIETYGLFSHHYLSRNLTVAFTLLPELSSARPYVSISGHGLAMWLTTPLLFFALWPVVKGPLHRPLWITVALVAVPTLFYQNSGWFQFGYRFGLDYLVLLLVLIAVGGRSLGRVGKGLIVAGVVINLFGAVTFNRMPEYYRGDYGTVVKH